MGKTSNSVKSFRVLVLGAAASDEEFHDWIDSHACVSHVDTFEEALQTLRSESFDLVISRAADFIPLQGVHSTSQAAAIIDSVSQGVCIVRQTGDLDWANPTFLSFSDEVRDKVRECCVETSSWAQEQSQSGSDKVRGRRFSFTTSANERYEVTATPVVDIHHRLTQVAAVVWNVTNAGRLQDQIEAIDRAGREMLSLDTEQVARLNPQERLSLLEQKVLRCTQELLHFDNFEIRILDRQTNRLEPVLFSGTPSSCTNTELFAEAEGNGICGYVASRGRSYICPNVADDPRYVTGVNGAQSSLTVPLTLHDQVIGVANFESTKVAAFNEDDRQFVEIFQRYIALALHIFELLASERQTTVGQVGSNMMGEITAPVNDILTDIENLVEDYIGHDDLRHRLRAISENAVRIRETVKELTVAKPSIVGLRRHAARRRDPILEGRRILLVDDEDVIRETVRDVLTGYGCDVRTASDGGTAIKLIGEGKFDLVLSDIKMPVKNGYEVFAAAKNENPNTPVILTTGFGYDPNHSIIRARREGLSAVLFKPFKVDQLLGEIRSALKSVKS